MELKSLDNILQKVASTLNFLDFTFLISGFATFCIISFTIKVYFPLPLPDCNFLNVSVGILFIYISGILSYSAGKYIRKRLLRKKFNECFKDTIVSENNIKDIEGYNGQLINPFLYNNATLDQLYGKMWISLRHSEKGKATVDYLNRSVMMQSICEGLFFSSLTLTVCSLILMIHSYSFYLLIVFFFSLLAAFFFSKEAERSALIQIREVVGAYYKFVLDC